MNSPDSDESVDDAGGAAIKTLALDTAKNLETDIVSDYFKDHNAVKMFMSMFGYKTITDTVKYILGRQPGWRIKTYKEYYSEYQGGEAYYETDNAQKNIPTINKCAVILNEEITRCEAGEGIDEERFKNAWNDASFAVFGNRNSQI